MGKLNDLLESSVNKLSVSRRSFMKGAVAMSAAAGMYGCSKDDDAEIIYSGSSSSGGSASSADDLTPDLIRYGTSGHNCGGKCLIVAHVKNGRIIRFLTDDHQVDANGNWVDEDNPNCSQSRACAKCRAYKFRLYHPGRLKYPLKQTKKRGDLSGFVRCSWEEALNEVARKHKAIVDKWSSKAVFMNYACGAYSGSLQGGGYTGLWTPSSQASRLIGGHTPYTNDYSFHQSYHTSYTGYPSSGPSNALIASGQVKHVVLWGSNILSTVNPRAYSWIRSFYEMRKNGGKVHFIGPEFVDTGVTCADEWIQMKPYTDTAVICGMLHHLICNTFDSNGNIRTDVEKSKQLDVNYIDSFVYGFFDSPEYWLNTSDASISLTDPGASGYTKVNAVPAGRSWSAYIMGSDDRLTKAAYGTGNYMSKQFATVQPTRNAAVCSYPNSAGAATQYTRKAEYLTPKTPEWAEKISGVPADKIRELAEMYVDEANHPIYNEWCGAQQKQSEGVINMLAVRAFLGVVKDWGMTGAGYARSGMSASQASQSGSIRASVSRSGVPSNPAGPTISCVTWSPGIKFAFRDQLKAGGYTGKHVPDWDWDSDDGGERVVHMDDGGAKALVKWQRDDKGALIQDADGYYLAETDASGKPIYTGLRFIMNAGGNILMNQHMNPNDAKEMFECLPIASTNPDDPDTLCIVAVDNFLSPTPRWADYIFPAATNWEQEDVISVTMGNGVYIPVVSAPPGQSKSMWNFTNEFLKAYEKIDPEKEGIAAKFTGGVPNQQIEDIVKKDFAKASTTDTSPYYKKTWDEFLSCTYLPRSANAFEPENATVTKTALRTNLDTYLADADNQTTGFAKSGSNYGVTAYGNQTTGGQYSTKLQDENPMPAVSRRIHVFFEGFVWHYEHRFEKYHGYLPAERRGQANKDFEGDPLVYPIPMYYNYEDYFKEAYGVMNGKHQLPDKPILVTTTHDRYRAHSSMSENPYLRELTHRVKGGKIYSGNDWNEYALIGEGKEGETFPRLNKAIEEKSANASWSEIWMNDEDAAERGIEDGDLVLAENPVGAVRCTARVTKRCVKGMAGLHQGCWYDPDPVDGVDDGGCANTLMASRPSRFDHGNGQQSAMVSITKVNQY